MDVFGDSMNLYFVDSRSFHWAGIGIPKICVSFFVRKDSDIDGSHVSILQQYFLLYYYCKLLGSGLPARTEVLCACSVPKSVCLTCYLLSKQFVFSVFLLVILLKKSQWPHHNQPVLLLYKNL